MKSLRKTFAIATAVLMMATMGSTVFATDGTTTETTETTVVKERMAKKMAFGEFAEGEKTQRTPNEKAEFTGERQERAEFTGEKLERAEFTGERQERAEFTGERVERAEFTGEKAGHSGVAKARGAKA